MIESSQQPSIGSDRRWLTLIAMTGSLSMIMLDSTVLGVALPSIQRDLAFDDSAQAWAVNGYLLAMASWVALGGRIGDWIGRINAFRLGMVGFALASVACAFAPSAWFFVAARVAQGVFAATMQPASAAIVIDIYPPTQRGRAMAAYAGISLLFLASGPVIGGALVELVSWQWCFLLNVPVTLGSLALTLKLNMKSIRSASRVTDLASVALLLVGAPLFVSGLQEIGHERAFADSAWMRVLVGAGLLAFFVRRQFRLVQPTIDLRLFRDRELLACAFVLFCTSFITVGQGIYGSVYLQSVLGFTPLEAGLGTLPLMVPVLVVIQFAGRMYDKHGARKPIIIGFCFIVAGTIIETVAVFAKSYPVLALGMALLGTGCGFAMSPANAESLARAPAIQRGEASGLVQMMRQFGATIGIALFVLAMTSMDGIGGSTANEIGYGFALDAVIAVVGLWAGWKFIHSSTPTT